MARCDERVAEDWYTKAFDALYPVIYAHRSVEAAAPEAEFAARQTSLGPNDAILDLCCGSGRHMTHLLPRARRVTGFDYSSALLSRARALLGGCAGLVRGDMRALPFRDAFDAVFSFFTSFGYFMRDEENFAVLHNMARVLKPGGRFFFDYLNADHVRNTLVGHSTREQAEFTIREERWIDETAQRVNKTVSVFRNDEEIASFQESVRLYTPTEMTRMFAEAGLAVDQSFGDYSGAHAAQGSPRLLLVGHKHHV